MEKRLCKYCDQDKLISEFNELPKNKCKSCIKEYMQARQQRLNKKNGVVYLDCIGCGVTMRNPQSKICQKCSRNHEKFDIKTAADFRLPKGDVNACRLAFIIACGLDVKDYLDDCFTAIDAYNEEIQREPRVHVNDVDPNVIEIYEEHESHWFESFLLKEPETTVERKMKEVLERRLDELER